MKKNMSAKIIQSLRKACCGVHFQCHMLAVSSPCERRRELRRLCGTVRRVVPAIVWNTRPAALYWIVRLSCNRIGMLFRDGEVLHRETGETLIDKGRVDVENCAGYIRLSRKDA